MRTSHQRTNMAAAWQQHGSSVFRTSTTHTAVASLLLYGRPAWFHKSKAFVGITQHPAPQPLPFNLFSSTVACPTWVGPRQPIVFLTQALNPLLWNCEGAQTQEEKSHPTLRRRCIDKRNSFCASCSSIQASQTKYSLNTLCGSTRNRPCLCSRRASFVV